MLIDADKIDLTGESLNTFFLRPRRLPQLLNLRLFGGRYSVLLHNLVLNAKLHVFFIQTVDLVLVGSEAERLSGDRVFQFVDCGLHVILLGPHVALCRLLPFHGALFLCFKDAVMFTLQSPEVHRVLLRNLRQCFLALFPMELSLLRGVTEIHQFRFLQIVLG